MTIPYGRQDINDDDIKAIISVLKSDYLTTGPLVYDFERKFAEAVHAKYAVAVSNGTAALHLACLTADLASKHELITSAMTFAASANCALYCGAKPVFIDTDQNGLMDVSLLSKKISKKTHIVIPVHYSGRPVDLQPLSEIAQKSNLVVIEDACHALGASYDTSTIGDCRFSDMTVFSFHPVKHITTGEGGMITTNSKEYYEKLLMLRTHGITKKKENLHDNVGEWYHEMQLLGYNYRLTDIQCALGVSQLTRLKAFVARRIEIAAKYYTEFKNNPYFEMLYDTPHMKSSFHLFPILLSNKYISRKTQIFHQMRLNGLGVQVHYIPVYWHPYYQQLGYSKGICPNTEKFYMQEISIPMYSALSDSDVDLVINRIWQIFKLFD